MKKLHPAWECGVLTGGGACEWYLRPKRTQIDGDLAGAITPRHFSFSVNSAEAQRDKVAEELGLMVEDDAAHCSPSEGPAGTDAPGSEGTK